MGTRDHDRISRHTSSPGRSGSPQQYLRVHVTNLRRKVEANAARPQLIVTEPGVGYRAELPA